MSDTVVTKERRGGLSAIWEAAVRYQALVVPIVAVLLAFGIGALLISMQGVNPSYAYNSLFRSALFIPSLTSVIVAGRRFGKTHGIAAPWLLRNLQYMPRSSGGITGTA